MKKITLVYYRLSDIKRQPKRLQNPWTWLDINYWAVWKTGGEFCHVDLVLDDQFIYSMNGSVGRLERVTNKTYSTPDRYKYQTLSVSELSFTLISRWCEKKYQKKLRFDTLGLLCSGFGLPFISFRRRMICSEFVIKALQQGDILKEISTPKKISPSELYDLLQPSQKQAIEMETIQIRTVY